MSDTREQIHKVVEKEINLELSKKFEEDLSLAKKTNKKKIKAKFQNQIKRLEDELAEMKATIQGLNQENMQKDERVNELEEQLIENDWRLTRLSSQNSQMSVVNQSLETNLEDVKAELENVNEENKAKDTLIEELQEPQNQNLRSTRSSIKKMSKTVMLFSPEAKIELDLNDQKDKLKIQEISWIKLPAIKKFKIENLTANDENLKCLLKNSCPPKLNFLCLNPSYNGEPTKLKCYIDDLIEWCEVTTDQIYLNNFEINSEDLSTIIKSSSQCDTLIIKKSIIHVSDDLDFSLDYDYNISNLSFDNCGREDRSSWKKKRTELISILKSIANSGLKDSLKKISLYNRNNFIRGGGYPNSLDCSRKVLEEAGLDKNLAVFEQWSPTEN